MTKSKRVNAYEAVVERLRTQELIYAKFGVAVVDQMCDMICIRCSRKDCQLLPICLDGSLCPYFKIGAKGR